MEDGSLAPFPALLWILHRSIMSPEVSSSRSEDISTAAKVALRVPLTSTPVRWQETCRVQSTDRAQARFS